MMKPPGQSPSGAIWAIFALLCTALLAYLLAAVPAQAYTYAIQPAFNDVAPSSFGNIVDFVVTGVEGVPLGMSLYLKRQTGSTPSPISYRFESIERCPAASFLGESFSYPANCSTGWQDIYLENIPLAGDLTDACELFTVDFNATTEMVANDYYHFRIARTGGQVALSCGSETNPIPYSRPAFSSSGEMYDHFVTLSTNNDPSGFILNQQNEDNSIVINQPTYGSTTASTTFNYSVFFSIPLSFDFRPETIRTIEIADAVTGVVQFLSTTTVPANSIETVTVTGTTTLPAGSKTIRAYYSYTNGTPYSNVVESFFNVVDNSYLAATGFNTPREGAGALSQNDCDLYDLGCQFQRALLFVFYPSENSLDRFANIWQQLLYLKPFGYVTVTLDQLKGIDGQGAGAFDLGEIPFLASIFTPFQTLLSGILWGVFGLWFYSRRLAHLDL